MTKVLYAHYGDQWIRGSERVLLDLLSHAPAAGVEPTLWTNVAPLAKMVAAMGIQVEYDDFSVYFDYDAPKFSPRQFLGMVNRGIGIARRSGAELIHCNSAAPLQWCLPISWRLRRPILVHLHAPYLRRSRLVTGIALADHIVGVSAATLDDCYRDGIDPARMEVIYNGVVPERLTGTSRIDIRSQLGIPAEMVVFAIIGSLVQRKGHDILFAAFDRLAARYPHLNLAVIGGGPDEHTLRALATSPRIHFLGECAQVGGLLQGGIDALVVPSRREAAGLVIAEAGLFGIPCIGSRIDGIPEMIREDGTGLLVPPNDPEALADAMAQLIENPTLRRQLGSAAQTLFHQKFHVDRMTEAFANSYRALQTKGGGRLPSLPGRVFQTRASWIS